MGSVGSVRDGESVWSRVWKVGKVGVCVSVSVVAGDGGWVGIAPVRLVWVGLVLVCSSCSASFSILAHTSSGRSSHESSSLSQSRSSSVVWLGWVAVGDRICCVSECVVSLVWDSCSLVVEACVGRGCNRKVLMLSCPFTKALEDFGLLVCFSLTVLVTLGVGVGCGVHLLGWLGVALLHWVWLGMIVSLFFVVSVFSSFLLLLGVCWFECVVGGMPTLPHCRDCVLLG